MASMDAQIQGYNQIFSRCIEEGRSEARDQHGSDFEKFTDRYVADQLFVATRELCKNDLFYLMVYALGREDIKHPWLFDRCREVQAGPDGFIDLWAREHCKDLADTTPMLTGNRGWTSHGDLQVGDMVFAPTGEQVMVVATSERFSGNDCYELEFNSGEKIVAGAGHLWRIMEKHRKRIGDHRKEKRTRYFTERVVPSLDVVKMVASGQRVDVGRWYVVGARRIGSVPTKCIQVASKDGMYLTGKTLIPTHNSSIITFGKTIQDILVDPNITVGIFSHTKRISRGFLKQIKYELEQNEKLKRLFPEILYADPKKEAPEMGNNWTDDGITVKRTQNSKEMTVESHGVVDGQPTSKHFKLLIYDDIVTLESVSTPDQIAKTTEALAISYNLGARGGRRRWIGTRYHFNDTYKTLMDRGTAIPRIYPATDNGKETGVPVLLDPEVLAEKRRDMGPYVFGSQMLLDPSADSTQGFQEEWLTFFETEPELREMNIYILVDPANSKKKSSDYTTMWVVALGADRNYYLLDGIHDRLNLTQRTQALFDFHMEYTPQGVGYEQYGMQADIQHIETEMERLHYRFVITPLSDSTPKNDRIRRLVPVFEQKRMITPRSIWKTNYEGKRVNLISELIEDEYKAFPVMLHDDMLDCLAQIKHPKMVMIFPRFVRRKREESWQDKLKRKLADSKGKGQTQTSFMST